MLPDLHDREMLVSYVTGDCPPGVAERIADHVATCEPCRNFVSFLTTFNSGLEDGMAKKATPAESCPDPSLLIALEAGEVEDLTAQHVRAHLLFCNACHDAFFCLRGIRNQDLLASWRERIEQLKSTLIDLGMAYGAGTRRGFATIIADGPALALRSVGTSAQFSKVVTVDIGGSIFSIDIGLTDDGCLSCDIAGIDIRDTTTLTVSLRSEDGHEQVSAQADQFGNTQLFMMSDQLPGGLCVLRLEVAGIGHELLFSIPGY